MNKVTLQVECVFLSIWLMSTVRATTNLNVLLVFRDIILAIINAVFLTLTVVLTVKLMAAVYLVSKALL